MYFNNLKKLRNNKDLTQEEISNVLKCKRVTYSTWENGTIIIPIKVADQLTIFYNVSLSYLLGLNDNDEINHEVKSINYEKLLKNLQTLKSTNNNSFQQIASNLKCDKSTCNRYFNGKLKIPTDRLILLSKFYRTDIDLLVGKKD